MAGPASADSIYDTQRIIGHRGSECIGTARNDCYLVRTAWTRLPVGGSQHVYVQCPARFPNVAGWDARHHEHIDLVLMPPPANGTAVAADGSLHGILVAASNKAHESGAFRIYVGCSRKPFASDQFRTASHATPSQAANLKGARP